jgi:heme-degrading monooxygenase HmoA
MSCFVLGQGGTMRGTDSKAGQLLQPSGKDREVMKKYCLPKRAWLLSGFLALAIWGSAAAAAPEPVLRMASLKAKGAAQQKEVRQVAVDVAKAYAAAKGCQWVKFWSCPSTLEEGTVSLWDSRADLEAFEKSDAYEAVRKKLAPLVNGKISVKVLQTYTPK